MIEGTEIVECWYFKEVEQIGCICVIKRGIAVPCQKGVPLDRGLITITQVVEGFDNGIDVTVIRVKKRAGIKIGYGYWRI